MTLYFYDLETSGFNPRAARIMQFAGQRTDMDLKPIGKPDNILIKITPDVLPDPDAVLVTGITPQATLADGITEAEFTKYLINEVCTSDTIMVGFNNIRFDDEFLRYILWRNFYDAYEWHWKDGCSRWDLLDVVRMTRALRPEGIEWPFAPDGKPANRLELLSAINKLEHANAHDALSDVNVTIDIAKLIKTKQPKLFDYLLTLRDKQKVEALVAKGQPVVYTSGKYPSEFEKTTIAVRVASNPFKKGALMYDLRIDPTPYLSMTSQELAKAWQARPPRVTHADGVQGAGEQRTKDVQNSTLKEQSQPVTPQSTASTSGAAGSASSQAGAVRDVWYFPVKTLAYNRCPAVAPLNVLDKNAAKRIKIDMAEIKDNLAKLQKAKDFGKKLTEALEIMQPKTQSVLVVDEQEVDAMLYDGFVNDSDKTKMRVVRAAHANELAELQSEFTDERLKVLLPLYKARNFPKALSGEEQEHWEEFRKHRLLDGDQNSRAAKYFKRLSELGATASADSQSQYLIEELNLYGQAVLPVA